MSRKREVGEVIVGRFLEDRPLSSYEIRALAVRALVECAVDAQAGPHVGAAEITKRLHSLVDRLAPFSLKYRTDAKAWEVKEGTAHRGLYKTLLEAEQALRILLAGEED